MPLTDALTKHLKTKDLIPAAAFIDGAWIDTADSGKSFEVRNPSTGELLATLPDMGVAETRRRRRHGRPGPARRAPRCCGSCSS